MTRAEFEVFMAELRGIVYRAVDRGVRVVTLPQLERELAQRASEGPMWTWAPLVKPEVSR